MTADIERTCKELNAIISVAQKMSISVDAACRAFNAFARFANLALSAEFAVYKVQHRRVVHLAYHHKKARVRKKNLNRIRRQK